MTRPESRPARATIASWCFAILSAAAVTAATVVMRPTVGVDAARGLLAGEQHLLGRSNALWQLVVADPADIRRDHLTAITWWPPGPQGAIYVLRRAGLTLGGSLKATALMAWLIGMSAWGVYFGISLRDWKRLWPWLIGLFALFRVSHATAFVYAGGDSLLWATFPIVALLNLRAARRAGISGALAAIAAGAASVVLILLKYVGAILAIGFAVFWLANLVRRRTSRAQAGAWAAGACLGAAAVFVNMPHALAGQTPAAAQVAHYMPTMLTLSVTGPLVALTDIIDAVTTVLNRRNLELPGYGLIGLLAAGVGAVFLAWWFLGGRRPSQPADRETPARADAWTLALSLVIVTSVALGVLWWRGAVVSWESRHQQYGAFLLLPFLMDALSETFRSGRLWRRAVTLACGGLFLVFPAVYGAAGLANKVFVRTPALRTSYLPSGLGIYWTADGSGAEPFGREVEALPWFRTALLATPSPDIALMFPGERVLLALDSRDALTSGFMGVPPGGVALLMPPWFPPKSGDDLRRTFKDVRQWTRVDLTTVPGAQLWHGQ